MLQGEEEGRGTPVREFRHGRMTVRQYVTPDERGNARWSYELTAPGQSMMMRSEDFRSAVGAVRNMVHSLRREREAWQAAAQDRKPEAPRAEREHRQGRAALRHYVAPDERGIARRHFELSMPGKSMTMVAEDFRSVVEAVRGLARSLRDEQGQVRHPRTERDWHAVVEVERLLGDDRAQVRIVRNFTGKTGFSDAATYCVKNKGRNLCLYGESFGAEPPVGGRLEVRTGQRADIDRAIDQFRRGQERGRNHCMGVWYDPGSAPQIGQRVNFTTGIDYRSLYEDRKVTPLHAGERGQKGEPLYVVFEMDPRMPGLGRVVDVTRVRPEALAKVKHLDQERQVRQQVSLRNGLENFSFNQKLRQDYTQNLSP